jgi:hypothetical protein
MLTHDDSETEASRVRHKQMLLQHETAINTHNRAKAVTESDPGSAEAKMMEKNTDKAHIKSKEDLQKAKEEFDNKIQLHDAKRASLSQHFKAIFWRNGVKREPCHGGKFNGVNCIWVMEIAEDLLLGLADKEAFLQKHIALRHVDMLANGITSKYNQHAQLLWPSVVHCSWN